MENKTLSLRIGKKELQKAIEVAGSAVPNNAIVMAAENLLIEIKDDNLIYLTGTDTNVTISTVAKCLDTDIIEGNSFMISYKFLSALLKKLPDVPLLIEHMMEEIPKAHASAKQLYKYTAEVFVQDVGNYKIPCENPQDFPIPNFTADKTFTMDVQQFRHGLRHTKDFYRVALETYPAMSGVRMDCMADLITMCGFTFSKGCIFRTNVKTQAICAFTLPDKLTNFLFNNIKEGAEGDIKFMLGETAVKVKYKGFTILSTLYQGQYPNYGVIMNVPPKMETTISLNEWRVGLERALVFSNENGEVKHTFAGGQVHLASSDSRYDTASDQYIDVSEDIDLDITLNGKDIIQSSASASGTAVIQVSDIPNDPNIYVFPQEHEGDMLQMFFATFRQ